MPEDRLCAQIFKNNSNLKTISAPLDTRDWKTYRTSLKNVQKEVNTFLSELVEEEKSTQGGDIEENDSDEDDESDADESSQESTAKRKSSVNEVITTTKRTKT